MRNAQQIPAAGAMGAVSFGFRINGQALPTGLPVYGLTVSKEVNRIPHAKILIIDGSPAKQDFEVSNQDWFVPGNVIEIKLGYLGGEAPVFKGIVIKQQITIRRGVSMLEVDCRDAAYRMTLRRQGRYFENMKDSDAAIQILQSYGITPQVSDTGYSLSELVQHDCTDWDFLVCRMECNGLLVIIDDGLARIQAPDFKQEVALHLEHGATVIEFDGHLELRDQHEQVAMRYWDPKEQIILEAFAKEPGIKENGNLSGLTLAPSNGQKKITWRHGGRSNDAEMQAWANARLLKDRLSRTCGRVQFQGYNLIKPGQIVMLRGFGQRFDGPVYVAAVHQEYLESGWLTEIEFGLSPKWFAEIVRTEAPRVVGMLPPVSGLQIGIVTQIEDDPEGMSRIRVRLPMLDAETGGVWARVAAFDAGAGRGAFFRPELNDEVIIGFVQDDPRSPVVLGMLHSSQNPAPFEAASDNNEKGFVSRNGIRLVFHEEQGAVTLQTPKGNAIILSDENNGILLEDQHGNRIEMNEKGITLSSKKDIKADAQSNCTLSAQQQLKAASNGNAQFSAGAIAEIKGSLVKIN
jgi:Rhs element Vgr protein